MHVKSIWSYFLSQIQNKTENQHAYLIPRTTVLRQSAIVLTCTNTHTHTHITYNSAHTHAWNPRITMSGQSAIMLTCTNTHITYNSAHTHTWNPRINHVGAQRNRVCMHNYTPTHNLKTQHAHTWKPRTTVLPGSPRIKGRTSSMVFLYTSVPDSMNHHVVSGSVGVCMFL